MKKHYSEEQEFRNLKVFNETHRGLRMIAANKQLRMYDVAKLALEALEEKLKIWEPKEEN